MPPLPQISSAALIKSLVKLGFTQRGGKGSHTVLRRGSVVTVVPHRDPVPRGTLRNVLRQSGVSIEEIAEVL